MLLGFSFGSVLAMEVARPLWLHFPRLGEPLYRACKLRGFEGLWGVVRGGALRGLERFRGLGDVFLGSTEVSEALGLGYWGPPSSTHTALKTRRHV